MNIDMSLSLISFVYLRQINGCHVDGVISKLGYLNSCRIETNGFLSGIWILWNDNVHVKILGLNSQVIHMWIGSSQYSWRFYCLTIYASPQRSNRRDFNSLLDVSERRGGSATSRNRCAFFSQDFLFNYELRDLGYCGSRFTWSRGGLSQHLDQAIENSSFDIFAPECLVRNLHRLKSNHRPIFVSLKPRQVEGTRPFRCLDSWMLHSEFRMLASSNWNSEDRAIELRQALEEVLKQEKLLWFQKSWSVWLLNGDRNTKYFHGRTLARRRRNKIEGLKVDGTDWCFDLVLLKQHVVGFYKNLFAMDYSVDGFLPCRGKFQVLSLVEKGSLDMEIQI
ncbi:hypothetical protein ES332_A12G002000v1 [Gossypium tomentosum]|uniref:Endonuclease/exonuclease/phosphatase domain-containing protein n=1 Tax=Gossypium tomentosum TaxID=34277 RepID=A0A5D2MQX6_GOSTO|nr:hypothetical protein ES332_A12G002000v1 [Gossypium tomentosum]